MIQTEELMGHEFKIESNGQHKLFLNGIHLLSDSHLLTIRNFKYKLGARIINRCQPFNRTISCWCGELISFNTYAAWENHKQNHLWIDDACPKCSKVECSARDCKEMIDRDADYNLCWDCQFELQVETAAANDRAKAFRDLWFYSNPIFVRVY